MSTLPSPEKLTAIGASMGFSFRPADAEEFLGLMAPFFERASAMLAAPDPLPAVKCPRTPGYKPSVAEAVGLLLTGRHYEEVNTLQGGIRIRAAQELEELVAANSCKPDKVRSP